MTSQSRSPLENPNTIATNTTQFNPPARPRASHKASSGLAQSSLHSDESNARERMPGNLHRPPMVDFLPFLDALTASIKRSTACDMKAERSWSEAEQQRKLQERHASHRQAFPALFEDTEHRVCRAEQAHQAQMKETETALQQQNNAVSALATVLEQNQSVIARHSDVVAEMADLKAENREMKRTQERTQRLLEVLETRFSATTKSLESSRREIDHMKSNTLTHRRFEARLQDCIETLITRKDYKTLEDNLATLGQDFEARELEVAKLRGFITPMSEAVQKWTTFTEDCNSTLSSLNNVTAKQGEMISNGLDAIQDQQRETNVLRDSIGEVRQIMEGFVSSAEAGKSGNSVQHPPTCVSKEDLETIEQKVESGHVTLLHVMREELKDKINIIMEEAQETFSVQDQHAKDLSALRQTMADMRKSLPIRQEGNPEDTTPRLPATLSQPPILVSHPAIQATSCSSSQLHGPPQALSANSSFGQRPLETHPNRCTEAVHICGRGLVNSHARTNAPPQQLTGVSQRPVPIPISAVFQRIETHLGSLERRVQNTIITTSRHQQSLDHLAKSRFPKGEMDIVAQTFPYHPTLLAARIDVLDHGADRLQQRVTELSDKQAASFAALNDQVLQLRGDGTKEIQFSWSKLQQYCTNVGNQMNAEFITFRTLVKNDVKQINDKFDVMTLEIARLKAHSHTCPPSPSSLNSRAPSHALAAKTPTDSDSDRPLCDLRRSSQKSPMEESSRTQNDNGKRHRDSPSSSDEDIPLKKKGTVATKQEKQVRRRNTSHGSPSSAGGRPEYCMSLLE